MTLIPLFKLSFIAMCWLPLPRIWLSAAAHSLLYCRNLECFRVRVAFAYAAEERFAWGCIASGLISTHGLITGLELAHRLELLPRKQAIEAELELLEELDHGS